MRWCAALAALALLGVTAAGGHAISGRATSLGVAASIGHLAAMSMWVGGLAVLLLVTPLRRFWSTATKFSPVALGSMALLAVTGVANGWRQMGTLSGFTDSTYGRALLTKLVVVIVVVAIASVSRWVLRHDNDADDSNVDAPAGDGGVQRGSRHLTRTVTAEAVGALIILGITSVLVGSPPPVDAVLGGAPATASVSVVQGERIAQIDLEPAVTGGTTMHVTITSPLSLIHI